MSFQLLAECLLVLAALASICRATPRHIHPLGAAKTQYWETPLKWGGYALLLTALIVAVVENGWGLGLVEWFGALTLAAVIVVLIATYQPAWLRWGMWAALLLGIATLVMIFSA